MRVLITGICGFVGSALAQCLIERSEGLSVIGIDNLMRPGSEGNRAPLQRLGVTLIHGDIRCASDFEALPAVDWVIDAAANPSVLAGVKGGFTSRQLFEHNLASLVNVLEFCKAHKAGLLLLSTSRVYSIPALSALPLQVAGDAFRLDDIANLGLHLTSFLSPSVLSRFATGKKPIARFAYLSPPRHNWWQILGLVG